MVPKVNSFAAHLIAAILGFIALVGFIFGYLLQDDSKSNLFFGIGLLAFIGSWGTNFAATFALAYSTGTSPS